MKGGGPANMKTGLKFEDYQEALDGAGPKLKEVILERAAHDENLGIRELKRLAELAYPDPYA